MRKSTKIKRASAKRPAPRRVKPLPIDKAAIAAAQLPLLAVARQLSSWANSVLGAAGTATDLAAAFAASRVKDPRQRVALEKAGSLLRETREAAGLSVKELGAAIDVRDGNLLRLAERGVAALPFDIVLRLAGVLGRNDPVALAMNLTRSYNPELWKALEGLGVGKLLVQAGREREFANIYRAHDDARKLTDAEFAAVLAFMHSTFAMAMEFHRRARRK